MLRPQLTPDKPKDRPGLTQTAAAKRLGVTKWHLNRVLRGHVSSIRLTRRYNELLSQEGAR